MADDTTDYGSYFQNVAGIPTGLIGGISRNIASAAAPYIVDASKKYPSFLSGIARNYGEISAPSKPYGESVSSDISNIAKKTSPFSIIKAIGTSAGETYPGVFNYLTGTKMPDVNEADLGKPITNVEPSRTSSKSEQDAERRASMALGLAGNAREDLQNKIQETIQRPMDWQFPERYPGESNPRVGMDLPSPMQTPYGTVGQGQNVAPETQQLPSSFSKIRANEDGSVTDETGRTFVPSERYLSAMASNISRRLQQQLAIAANKDFAPEIRMAATREADRLRGELTRSGFIQSLEGALSVARGIPGSVQIVDRAPTEAEQAMQRSIAWANEQRAKNAKVDEAFNKAVAQIRPAEGTWEGLSRDQKQAIQDKINAQNNAFVQYATGRQGTAKLSDPYQRHLNSLIQLASSRPNSREGIDAQNELNKLMPMNTGAYPTTLAQDVANQAKRLQAMEYAANAPQMMGAPRANRISSYGAMQGDIAARQMNLAQMAAAGKQEARENQFNLAQSEYQRKLERDQMIAQNNADKIQQQQQALEQRIKYEGETSDLRKQRADLAEQLGRANLELRDSSQKRADAESQMRLGKQAGEDRIDYHRGGINEILQSAGISPYLIRKSQYGDQPTNEPSPEFSAWIGRVRTTPQGQNESDADYIKRTMPNFIVENMRNRYNTLASKSGKTQQDNLEIMRLRTMLSRLTSSDGSSSAGNIKIDKKG